MSVANNIKTRRLALRMSQQELADAMGYKTRSTIAKIESGENDVSQKKLQKFASILDTTVDALILDNTPLRSSIDISANSPELTRDKGICIILAGGKSDQNQQKIPKQFITVHSKPVIIYCMEAYQSHPSIDDIYIVCQKRWESIIKAYASQYGITKLKKLIPAGPTGMHSLKNALDHISNCYHPDDIVFVQESTRPIVTTETISTLLQACAASGSATICHSMNEYVQFYISENKVRYVDRNNLIALQSPEAHRLALLQEVFAAAEAQCHPLVESCCTMLLYNLGHDIHFVESDINNIKIAREEDLIAFSSTVIK